MKKFNIILPVTLIMILSACEKKDLKPTEAQKKDVPVSMSVLGESGNEEVKRIADAIKNPDYTIAIIDNPNFGKNSRKSQYDIAISGSSHPTTSITLNGLSYKPDSRGQWLRQSEEYRQFYGKEVQVRIKNENETAEFTIYVPKPAKVKQLGNGKTQTIKSTGNTLYWETDPASTTGKVTFYYELADNDELGSEEGVFKREALVIDDTGSFDLDKIIDNPKSKRIYFRMISGNAVATTIKEKKQLLHISTFDHHEYLIDK